MLKSTTNSIYQAFLLMIDRRCIWMFVTEDRQNPDRFDQIAERRLLKSKTNALSG